KARQAPAAREQGSGPEQRGSGTALDPKSRQVAKPGSPDDRGDDGKLAASSKPGPQTEPTPAGDSNPQGNPGRRAESQQGDSQRGGAGSTESKKTDSSTESAAAVEKSTEPTGNNAKPGNGQAEGSVAAPKDGANPAAPERDPAADDAGSRLPDLSGDLLKK